MYNFDQVYHEMERHGMKLPQSKIKVKIKNAQQVLESALIYFLKREDKDMIWLPEYDEVVDWLSDNQGRGLFLYGQCGRGKSLLGRMVLPAILLKFSQKVVSVFDMQDMNRDVDYALSKHLISLDDVGTEEQSVKYGQRRWAFDEIVDAAEKYNKLILISSNQSVDNLRERYGDRTLDRIKSTTKRIMFRGESLRS
ncbi:hypothetical protein [Dysgonomonas sp. ZJ279]|uniref:hypothetical protein n=1 Tax=Dysgonomonas sp. ZJ279 TaxID=2709796 RepID=UPI0013EB6BC9|nr:hypothetical protein [Dysgonomonas sp. ZJ279]